MTAEQIFLDFSVRKLRQYMERIAACTAPLTVEQIWSRDSPACNAIGNLLLHLEGNVRQWILGGVGGRPDHRDRDREFALRGGLAKADLLRALQETVTAGTEVLERLPAERLLESVTIQQHYKVSILEAVYHVVEHFGQHTAQVIYISKSITKQDLGFYSHLSGGTSSAPLTP
jgi:uncharacterized damage-inducible protein DinB